MEVWFGEFKSFGLEFDMAFWEDDHWISLILILIFIQQKSCNYISMSAVVVEAWHGMVQSMSSQPMSYSDSFSLNVSHPRRRCLYHIRWHTWTMFVIFCHWVLLSYLLMSFNGSKSLRLLFPTLWCSWWRGVAMLYLSHAMPLGLKHILWGPLGSHSLDCRLAM